MATGALARTATNVRAGARSPIAALTHSIFVLLAVVGLAPILGHLPMAALAALLLLVAWNMSEVRHFVHVVRVAPKSDVLVLLSCFGLTVVFDMVIAVGVGIVLAALLFMQRMSSLFDARVDGQEATHAPDPRRAGVLVYRVAGPLFFGAAEKAASALARVPSETRGVVLVMDDVPVMDVTGLVTLESAIQRLRGQKIRVVLAGVQAQPMELLRRSEAAGGLDGVAIRATVEGAIDALGTAPDSTR